MKYKVKKGDTLSTISEKLGVSIDKISSANAISGEGINRIYAGEILEIPEQGRDESLAASLGIPINLRQFFNADQDRTEKDLSKEELSALKNVIKYSQTPERRLEKEEAGLNPDYINYQDYNHFGAADVSQVDSEGSLLGKVTDPYTVMKTYLGRFKAEPQDSGGYKINDVFDFPAKTEETGLKKLAEYAGSVTDLGFDPYGQLRNYMGYYGPQEGSGQGGRSNINIALSQGGKTRHNFNRGGNTSMNIQQQTQNVAAQGRYGDSMLMHVNPAEVRGLSQVAPITINPQTGQPEAFLPFLVPLLGSLLGGSLLGGTALGTLGASALGSGLATWAATGDLKKGLLAGITGYGIGAALQGAGAAAAGADAATAAADVGKTALTESLLTDPTMLAQAGTEAAQGIASAGSTVPAASLNALGETTLNSALASAQPGFQLAGQTAADAYTGAGYSALGDAFSGGLGPGVQNLAAGASQPLAVAGIAGGMGPTAVMDSQEQFAEQMRQMQEDTAREKDERTRQMFESTPEPILYSAQGGPTNIDESLMMDANLLSGAMNMNSGGRVGYGSGGGILDTRNSAYNRINDKDYNQFSGDQQRFTPARQTFDINPEFMAGFQPETMYFEPNTMNQPASATTTDGPPVLSNSYTGSQGGYNMMGVEEAPLQTIDPYAPYTGLAPQGLVETGFNPVPVSESVTSDISKFPDKRTTPSNIDFSDIDFSNIDYSSLVTGGVPGSGSGSVSRSGSGDYLEDDFILDPSRYNESSLIHDPADIDFSNFDYSSLDPSDIFNPFTQELFEQQNRLQEESDIYEAAAGGETSRGKKAEGGETDNIMQDPITQEVVLFITGESDNQQAINDFVSKYGAETFSQLRDYVLKALTNENVQTEGQIQGVGNSGMADDIPGMIGANEKIAVSQDEFIVPADVVSALGDGSSNAGSNELYAMMDRVRQEKTGTTRQAPKLANAGGLLPR